MMHRSLPQKLRILRAKEGLTLVDAAKRIGIGRDTLSDIERGNQQPVFPTLAKIARAYDVDIEELLEEPEASLARKADAPSRGRFAPGVEAWLAESGMRFALMSNEEFTAEAAAAPDFRTLASLEAEIAAEVDELIRALDDSEVRKRLFKPRVADYTERRDRLNEAMRPGREASALKRNLFRGYRAKMRVIEHMREQLFFGAEAPEPAPA
jgi:transcriptional regulator with XRE-family HTH domain